MVKTKNYNTTDSGKRKQKASPEMSIIDLCETDSCESPWKQASFGVKTTAQLNYDTWDPSEEMKTLLRHNSSSRIDHGTYDPSMGKYVRSSSSSERDQEGESIESSWKNAKRKKIQRKKSVLSSSADQLFPLSSSINADSVYSTDIFSELSSESKKSRVDPTVCATSPPLPTTSRNRRETISSSCLESIYDGMGITDQVNDNFKLSFAPSLLMPFIDPTEVNSPVHLKDVPNESTGVSSNYCESDQNDILVSNLAKKTVSNHETALAQIQTNDKILYPGQAESNGARKARNSALKRKKSQKKLNIGLGGDCLQYTSRAPLAKPNHKTFNQQGIGYIKELSDFVFDEKANSMDVTFSNVFLNDNHIDNSIPHLEDKLADLKKQNICGQGIKCNVVTKAKMITDSSIPAVPGKTSPAIKNSRCQNMHALTGSANDKNKEYTTNDKQERKNETSAMSVSETKRYTSNVAWSPVRKVSFRLSSGTSNIEYGNIVSNINLAGGNQKNVGTGCLKYVKSNDDWIGRVDTERGQPRAFALNSSNQKGTCQNKGSAKKEVRVPSAIEDANKAPVTNGTISVLCTQGDKGNVYGDLGTLLRNTKSLYAHGTEHQEKIVAKTTNKVWGLQADKGGYCASKTGDDNMDLCMPFKKYTKETPISKKSNEGWCLQEDKDNENINTKKGNSVDIDTPSRSKEALVAHKINKGWCPQEDKDVGRVNTNRDNKVDFNTMFKNDKIHHLQGSESNKKTLLAKESIQDWYSPECKDGNLNPIQGNDTDVGTPLKNGKVSGSKKASIEKKMDRDWCPQEDKDNDDANTKKAKHVDVGTLLKSHNVRHLQCLEYKEGVLQENKGHDDVNTTRDNNANAVPLLVNGNIHHCQGTGSFKAIPNHEETAKVRLKNDKGDKSIKLSSEDEIFFCRKNGDTAPLPINTRINKKRPSDHDENPCRIDNEKNYEHKLQTQQKPDRYSPISPSDATHLVYNIYIEKAKELNSNQMECASEYFALSQNRQKNTAGIGKIQKMKHDIRGLFRTKPRVPDRTGMSGRMGIVDRESYKETHRDFAEDNITISPGHSENKNEIKFTSKQINCVDEKYSTKQKFSKKCPKMMDKFKGKDKMTPIENDEYSDYTGQPIKSQMPVLPPLALLSDKYILTSFVYSLLRQFSTPPNCTDNYSSHVAKAKMVVCRHCQHCVCSSLFGYCLTTFINHIEFCKRIRSSVLENLLKLEKHRTNKDTVCFEQFICRIFENDDPKDMTNSINSKILKTAVSAELFDITGTLDGSAAFKGTPSFDTSHVAKNMTRQQPRSQKYIHSTTSSASFLPFNLLKEKVYPSRNNNGNSIRNLEDNRGMLSTRIVSSEENEALMTNFHETKRASIHDLSIDAEITLAMKNSQSLPSLLGSSAAHFLSSFFGIESAGQLLDADKFAIGERLFFEWSNNRLKWQVPEEELSHEFCQGFVKSWLLRVNDMICSTHISFLSESSSTSEQKQYHQQDQSNTLPSMPLCSKDPNVVLIPLANEKVDGKSVYPFVSKKMSENLNLDDALPLPVSEEKRGKGETGSFRDVTTITEKVSDMLVSCMQGSQTLQSSKILSKSSTPKSDHVDIETRSFSIGRKTSSLKNKSHHTQCSNKNVTTIDTAPDTNGDQAVSAGEQIPSFTADLCNSPTVSLLIGRKALSLQNNTHDIQCGINNAMTIETTPENNRGHGVSTEEQIPMFVADLCNSSTGPLLIGRKASSLQNKRHHTTQCGINNATTTETTPETNRDHGVSSGEQIPSFTASLFKSSDANHTFLKDQSLHPAHCENERLDCSQSVINLIVPHASQCIVENRISSIDARGLKKTPGINNTKTIEVVPETKRGQGVCTREQIPSSTTGLCKSSGAKHNSLKALSLQPARCENERVDRSLNIINLIVPYADQPIVENRISSIDARGLKKIPFGPDKKITKKTCLNVHRQLLILDADKNIIENATDSLHPRKFLIQENSPCVDETDQVNHSAILSKLNTPDDQATMEIVKNACATVLDNFGLPCRNITVVSKKGDLLYNFVITITASGIPNSGYGAFLTYRGARQLKYPEKLRSKKLRKFHDARRARRMLQADKPRKKGGATVKLSGDGFQGSDHILGEKGSFFKLMGLTESDYAPATNSITFSSFHNGCGYIDIGRYAPFLPSDRKSDLIFSLKSFFFALEPAAWGFDVKENLGEYKQMVDFTDDATGRPHLVARSNIAMYVNEIGHNDKLIQNVVPNMCSERVVKYLLFQIQPLKKGQTVELLADYTDTYEEIRERKGYGKKNIKNKVKCDKDDATRFDRNLKERRLTENYINSFHESDIKTALPFITENVLKPIEETLLPDTSRMKNKTAFHESSELETLCAQWVARRRIHWVSRRLKKQLEKVKSGSGSQHDRVSYLQILHSSCSNTKDPFQVGNMVYVNDWVHPKMMNKPFTGLGLIEEVNEDDGGSKICYIALEQGKYLQDVPIGVLTKPTIEDFAEAPVRWLKKQVSESLHRRRYLMMQMLAKMEWNSSFDKAIPKPVISGMFDGCNNSAQMKLFEIMKEELSEEVLFSLSSKKMLLNPFNRAFWCPLATTLLRRVLCHVSLYITSEEKTALSYQKALTKTLLQCALDAKTNLKKLCQSCEAQSDAGAIKSQPLDINDLSFIDDSHSKCEVVIVARYPSTLSMSWRENFYFSLESIKDCVNEVHMYWYVLHQIIGIVHPLASYIEWIGNNEIYSLKRLCRMLGVDIMDAKAVLSL